MTSALDLPGLEALLSAPPTPSASIQKLRTTHHELARLLALGLKDVEISRLTGYSQSRICILKTMPLFQELMVHYSSMRDNIVTDVSGRLRGLSLTALEILQEKIEDQGDGLTVKDLIAVSELGLDRTGFGKTSTQVNVSTTAESLEAIKSRINSEHRGRVLSRDQEPLVIEGTRGAAAVHEELPAAPEGREGAGPTV